MNNTFVKTALTLGKIIGDTIGSDFNEVAKYGRNLGPNKRLIGTKSPNQRKRLLNYASIMTMKMKYTDTMHLQMDKL